MPPVEKYCPSPIRPILAAPDTTTKLLDNYLTVVDYGLKLEKTIECYEPKKIAEGGK